MGTIISNLNLSEAEGILTTCYKYVPGKPGRPPILPTGMFLSFILMFLRVESYRDYQAFIEKDHFWRRQLGFVQTPDIGSFTHFIQRMGVVTFEKLFHSIVQQLINEGFLNLHFVAQDGSIIEGNQDDKNGKWGWDHINEQFVYGYKIHVIVDVRSELPVALSITKANAHDSTQFSGLYSETKSYDSRFLTMFFTADKAYDSTAIRRRLLKDDVKPIIKASKTRIKPRYPRWFKEKYTRRVSVERFFSRLKEFLDLKKLGVYSEKNVKIYAYLISIGMLLTGYINFMLGYSPRSVKTFLRKFT